MAKMNWSKLNRKERGARDSREAEWEATRQRWATSRIQPKRRFDVDVDYESLEARMKRIRLFKMLDDAIERLESNEQGVTAGETSRRAGAEIHAGRESVPEPEGSDD